MKELSKEDQERIEKERSDRYTEFGGTAQEFGFMEGAKYEHPMAYNQGFNEGIEAALRMTPKSSRGYEMIKNLKK